MTDKTNKDTKLHSDEDNYEGTYEGNGEGNLGTSMAAVPMVAPITSFDQFDVMDKTERRQQLSNRYNTIIGNIANSPDIELESKPEAILTATNDFKKLLDSINKVKNGFLGFLTKAKMKTEDGVSYPAKDFAYVPDPEITNTWKLRLTEDKPGNITKEQLGRAAAAFSPGGFRGQKVEIPQKDVREVKDKIKAEYIKLGVSDEDIPVSIKVQTPLQSKDFRFKRRDDGTVTWLAVYSNNYRDKDNIPEIISEASHKNFDRLLKEGEVDYPELWLHHIPNTVFGKAVFHAYDVDNGFSVAAGYIYPDKVWIVDHLEKIQSDIPLGVSHGMPSEFIKREDVTDPTVITSHITKEISVLPMGVAANKLTEFYINTWDKEKKRMTEAEKTTLLESLDFSNTQVARVEDGIDEKVSQAKEDNTESKAVKEETPTKVALVEPVKDLPKIVELNDRVKALEGLIDGYKTSETNVIKVVEALAAHVQELSKSINFMKNEVVKEQNKTDFNSDNFELGAYFNSLQTKTANNTATALKSGNPLYNDGPEVAKQAQVNRPTGTVLDKFIVRSRNGGKAV